MLTEAHHRENGRLARRQRGGVVSFPRLGDARWKLALGAKHYGEFVGALIETSTERQYGDKVDDWMQYCHIGGFDWREVTDSKVQAFAGWLSDPCGRGSRDKTLNGWTSALNNHFDRCFGVRPFNSHLITRLKKKYRDKQTARTLQCLVDRVPGYVEAKDQRLALPASGFAVLVDDAQLDWRGRVLAGIAIILLIAVFLLRPNTVWGFEPGDVVLLRALRRICIIVRVCKRWPELRLSPAAREVQCGGPGTPLGVIFDVMCRAEDTDPLWYRRVRDEAPEASGAAARVTAWLRERCDEQRVPRQGGRNFSAYSIRIAIASTMWAYRMDERWIQTWGYWRTEAQYKTYVREYYGRHPFVAGIVAFGFELQPGRPFDFVVPSRTRPRTDDSGADGGGLRGAGNNSGGALRDVGGRRGARVLTAGNERRQLALRLC